MNRMDYTFKFSIFAKKVQKFAWGDMGIVVEKERDVVCVYGTDGSNSNIYCAVPLCHPKYLKGETVTVSLFKDNVALVKVADIMVYIDFNAQKTANNKKILSYGSDDWGKDVGMEWDAAFER